MTDWDRKINKAHEKKPDAHLYKKSNKNCQFNIT